MRFFWIVLCCAWSGRVIADSDAEIDFGVFPANQAPHHVFPIKNSNSTPLVLKQARSNCGCAEPELSTRTVPPQGEAALTVGLKANSLTGPFVKHIIVETNQPGRRFLKFTLKGEAVPLIRVQPSPELYLGALAVGKEYEYRFRLTATRPGVKLRLRAPELKELTEAALVQNQEDWFLRVKILPLQPGQPLRAALALDVLEPDGWQAVEILLAGRSSEK